MRLCDNDAIYIYKWVKIIPIKQNKNQLFSSLLINVKFYLKHG